MTKRREKGERELEGRDGREERRGIERADSHAGWFQNSTLTVAKEARDPLGSQSRFCRSCDSRGIVSLLPSFLSFFSSALADYFVLFILLFSVSGSSSHPRHSGQLFLLPLLLWSGRLST